MKRLLLFLLIASCSLGALTPAEQQEVNFIAAIASGNIPGITSFLNKGMSANHQFTLVGHRGYTPLSIALMEKIPVFEFRNNIPQLKSLMAPPANQFQVIQLLMSRGANKAELNLLAQDAIAKGDATKALNLINAGASDKKLLDTLNPKLAKETSVAKKIIWEQIRKKLGGPAATLPVRPAAPAPVAPAPGVAPAAVPKPVPIAAFSAEQKERALYNALDKSDLAAVKAAIASGASSKEFSNLPEFKNVPFADRQPIVWVRSNPQRWAIIDYLLSTGIDRSALNGMLVAEVNEGDIDALKNLISRGAKDPEGKALAKLKEKEEEFLSQPQKLIKYSEIKKLLQSIK